MLQGEVAHWDGRITQLSGLRSYLEGLRGEAERRALAEHRRGVAEDRRTSVSELLRLTGVSKSYRRGSQELCVLREAHLDVQVGEVVCVLAKRTARARRRCCGSPRGWRAPIRALSL